MSETTTTTIRFHDYGDPAEVLRLEQAQIPDPGPGRIRVEVRACGLNPADWALCEGLFAGSLPRGIGLDVAGVVDAVGEGVDGIAVGDAVLGSADYAGAPSAGAAGVAILDHWAPLPEGLAMVDAAALPLAVSTAYAHLAVLGVRPGATVVVHGAGTTVGFAAVQIALDMGARVVATAGTTYAERLGELGALVTPYGEGMVERVRALADGTPDVVLDTAPVSGVLPDLVRIAGGDARRVLTASDFDAAAGLGVRTTFTEAGVQRYDVLGEYAGRAAAGTFSIPVARTYRLDEWRAAFELSRSGRAGGKLVLVMATAAPGA
jgi:NADPH:quinone reductase-like Zn-dependent oxidoreductase